MEPTPDPDVANESTYTSAAQFDDLNADCLREILLNDFTIHEQMLLRALGTKWNEAAEMNFRTVHSLKLFCGDSVCGD